jgi:hypothetical protein
MRKSTTIFAQFNRCAGRNSNQEPSETRLNSVAATRTRPALTLDYATVWIRTGGLRFRLRSRRRLLPNGIVGNLPVPRNVVNHLPDRNRFPDERLLGAGTAGHLKPNAARGGRPAICMTIQVSQPSNGHDVRKSDYNHNSSTYRPYFPLPSRTIHMSFSESVMVSSSISVR